MHVAVPMEPDEPCPCISYHSAAVLPAHTSPTLCHAVSVGAPLSSRGTLPFYLEAQDRVKVLGAVAAGVEKLAGAWRTASLPRLQVGVHAFGARHAGCRFFAGERHALVYPMNKQALQPASMSAP